MKEPQKNIKLCKTQAQGTTARSRGPCQAQKRHNSRLYNTCWHQLPISGNLPAFECESSRCRIGSRCPRLLASQHSSACKTPFKLPRAYRASCHLEVPNWMLKAESPVALATQNPISHHGLLNTRIPTVGLQSQELHMLSRWLTCWEKPELIAKPETRPGHLVKAFITA